MATVPRQSGVALREPAMKAAIRATIGVMLLACTLGAGAQDDGDSVAAVWQAHQVKFRYAGFTTYYTCDGIKGKLRTLLRTLGAKNDVKTTGSCPDRLQRTSPIHRVILAFSLPVVAPEGTASAETFPARWRKVKLKRGHPFSLGAGECELVEEFRDQIIVPLLNPQDLVDRTHCTPRQVNISGPHLEMTVLVPVPESELTASGDPGLPPPDDSQETGTP
jgi:hypothetical protein